MATGPGLLSSPGPEPLSVRIRIETSGDEPGIRLVHELAFPGPEEALIVDEIRESALEGWQSIIAVDAVERIVGHALLSPCIVEDDDGSPLGTVLAVGPIAVLPQYQFRGVGSSLMQAAAGLAVARGVPALVLLGQPLYYQRFGFSPARALGLLPPAEAWPDEAWMGRLLPAWTDELRGTVRYPKAFEPLA